MALSLFRYFWKRVKGQYDHLMRLFQHDLWYVGPHRLSKAEKITYPILKVVAIVSVGMVKNNCSLQAAALTYITLMTLVPLLAFVFSVAKGFNIQELLLRGVQEPLGAMPKQIRSFIEQLFNLVDQTDFTALGIIGLVVVFWTIIKVMGTIENSFNAIWRITENRPFIRKISDYLLVMIIGPLMIMLNSAILAGVFSSHLTDFLRQHIGGLFVIYELVFGFSGIIGIILIFAFIYGYLPNAPVKIHAALMGGLLAGTIWYFVQWSYIKFQLTITSYNAIYGAFATLPIFLIWVYVNWIIVLLGAEFSFAVQNHKNYSLDRILNRTTFATRLRLACLIVYEICHDFETAKGPWQPVRWRKRNFPMALVEEMLDKLMANKIIYEVDGGGYVPAMDPSILTLKNLYTSMSGSSDERLLKLSNEDMDVILGSLNLEERKFIQALSKKDYDDLVKDGLSGEATRN